MIASGPDADRPLAGRLVLLGVTGSIAAYKAAELVRLLSAAGADVQVLMMPPRITGSHAAKSGLISPMEPRAKHPWATIYSIPRTPAQTTIFVIRLCDSFRMTNGRAIAILSRHRNGRVMRA